MLELFGALFSNCSGAQSRLVHAGSGPAVSGPGSATRKQRRNMFRFCDEIIIVPCPGSQLSIIFHENGWQFDRYSGVSRVLSRSPDRWLRSCDMIGWFQKVSGAAPPLENSFRSCKTLSDPERDWLLRQPPRLHPACRSISWASRWLVVYFVDDFSYFFLPVVTSLF